MSEAQQEILASQPTDNYTPPDWKFITTIDQEGFSIAGNESYFTPTLNIYFGIGMLLIAAGVFFSFFTDMLFFSIIWVTMGILVLASRRKFPQWMVSFQVKKMQEVYHTSNVPFALVFWPQGLSVTNRLNHGRFDFRYEMIKRILRCNNYLIMVSKDNKCVVIHLDDVENHEDFVEYIRLKCPKAKFKTREL